MIMPIIFGLLCAIIIAAFVIGFFSTKTRDLCIISIFILLACICGTFKIVQDHNHNVYKMRERQEQLILYQSVVAACDNEYVRYDFYTKINAFNQDYAKLVNEQNNFWLSYFYEDNLLEDLNPIQFELHGGNYEVAD